jgi:hypothetical protein
MGLINKRLFLQELKGTLTTTLHHGSGLAISCNLHDLEYDRLFVKHRYCIDSRFLSLSCRHGGTACRVWPSTHRPPLRNAATLLWLWEQPGDDFEPEQKGTPENVLDLLDSWAIP